MVAKSARPIPLSLGFRPKEAAAALGISVSYLYLLMKRGKIRYRKVGAATLFLPADLDTFLANLAAVEAEVKPTGPLLPHDQQQLAIERATLDERGPPPGPAEQPPDFAAMVEDRRRLAGGGEEARLRAIEFVIGEYRRHHGCSSEQAKVAVLKALARPKEKA